jgi:hypothetical protein
MAPNKQQHVKHNFVVPDCQTASHFVSSCAGRYTKLISSSDKETE